jgi:hypothetical protein
MAKTKILLSTVSYGDVHPIPYSSHLNMFYRLGKEVDADFIFHSPWRVPIDTARNEAVAEALNNECEWLFFFDNDMALDPRIVQKLMVHDVPCVMAHCLIRGYPFEPMMFRFKDDENGVRIGLTKYAPTDEEYASNKLLKVDAVGTACTLIKTEVFRNMSKPYFQTGEFNTEDVYFCMKALNQIEGFECFVDLSFECGHMLNGFVLTRDNAKALKEFHEKGFNGVGMPEPSLIPNKKHANPLVMP